MPTSRAKAAHPDLVLPLDLLTRLIAFCGAVGEHPDDVIADAVTLALDEVAAPAGFTLRPNLVTVILDDFLDQVESRAGEIAAS